MPSQRQPKPLRMLCMNATSEMIISHVLRCSESFQEEHFQKFLYQHMPPVVIQDVLASVVRLLGTAYAQLATSSLISCLLRILLHPRLTEVTLSDLSFIGNVELESLDIVEDTLVRHFPAMSQLTHLDFSTHRFKITFPSCSDDMLEVLGSCCPNLQVLNLNFNNRVSGDGLSYLYPSEDYPGCAKLERVYAQDCSIEAEDVAMALCSFPNLELIGYKELGTSLRMLRSRPKKYGLWNQGHCLKLTHLDNTLSGIHKDDSDIVQFLVKACPYIENLKIRVRDENMDEIHKLGKLKHLEVRYYTGFHHPVGSCTQMYLRTCGNYLSSFTIYCNRLHSQHVLAIAQCCPNLEKLFLHANLAVIDTPLEGNKNKLQNLEMLNLRLGDDELVMNPAACAFLTFLLEDTLLLQELYVLVRSPEFNHDFIVSLLQRNPLSHLKNLIIDVPRRTLSAPMIELTVETASLLMSCSDKLKILGNLICWDVTPDQVAELRKTSRACNYNLNIIYANSNKLNTKYL